MTDAEAPRWDGADLILSIRVQPRAARDELCLQGTNLKARITAPPVEGKANAHLLEFLAREFGVSKSAAILISGATGRNKRIRVRAPSHLPAILQHWPEVVSGGPGEV